LLHTFLFYDSFDIAAAANFMFVINFEFWNIEV